ncbi:MAG: phage portal protein [Phycisphaerales bacterium]|nr:phage portal protein [Phycisphaerales bacterium]
MSDLGSSGLSGNAQRRWELVRSLIDTHENGVLPRLEQLWAYYRNPLELVRRSGTVSGSNQSGWYRMAQERGLPARVTGTSLDGVSAPSGRREVVIENDIGWRVGTMVDFMFGSPVRIESLTEKDSLRDEIEGVLERVWEHSGGISLMQDIATLGHVYGYVDLLVRVDEDRLVGASLETVHEAFSIEPIEPRRGVPIVSDSDYRVLDGYAIHFERELNELEDTGAKNTIRNRFGRLAGGGQETPARKRSTVTEVITGDGWELYEDGDRVSSGTRSVLGSVVPVVHIQNMSQPFVYAGLGEVEALIPLQDELNTRLSDRANRVTLQSFKMYLARGIEGFDGSGVGPGTVWSTDNPDASIVGFGGDASSPSEDRHIAEIREALDKISGVPPLAGGVVKAKLGNLSSANALRVTLMGLIAKTMRKRVTYGRGIEQVSGLVLRALDEAGVLRVRESERGVRVEWGVLGPIGDEESLDAAQAKVALGVPEDQVLGELGLDDADPGIV